MGNIIKKKPVEDPDSAWQEQNREVERNPMYKFADLNRGGKLVEAYRKGGVVAVQEIARREIGPYLYNGGKGKTVERIDYIKWLRQREAMKTGSTIWETKSDEELISEWNEHEKNSFNKVSTHEACWDLAKRGGVGETPLHLLYLMDSAEHVETAKILLNMYPKLALDFYEADEYYGESCLHLATVYGDFESVKLLVSNGAYVNQRATGRFFLPEDQKNARTKTTNYEGYAYYGEYPLAFAACFGYMDIYDYLIDNGADPNLQDSFGNTTLHMVVIADQPEMYKYMVKHHKKPAQRDIVNNENLTPLALASKLGRHRLFKEILELNSIEFWRYSNVTCSAYPLTEIDSISPNGEPNYSSALMIAINGEEDDHLEMLEGGVMRQLLDDKWKTFARKRFIQRLILTFIHLSMISVAIYLRPASDLLTYNSASDGVRFAAEIIVCLMCLAYLILEVIEIGAQGALAFLKNCRHAPDHTVFMLSCFLILLCIPFRFTGKQYVEDVLLILSVPGSWFFLLFFARSVKLTGPFVTLIYKMCTGDLFRFGIIYVIFLIGFTQGFYFLFRDINQESFSTLPSTIMTLFQMTLGEFKYHDFDLTRYALLTKLVFAVFMILVPILLLNMLIAMMGNTYQCVISKSEKEWRKQWAKIVVVLERGFTKKQLQHYHREYSIKLGEPSTENGKMKEELRALVVIKTSPKTKARQRKIAVGNWKKLGHEIILQLKEQKKKGKTGPLKLQRTARKPRKSTADSDEDEDKKFSNITAQLAWERDIDLTKGQAFTKNPSAIEGVEHVKPGGLANNVSGNHSPDKKSDKKPVQTEEHTGIHIANGHVNSARTIKKYVKKPNGTPKTSPKFQKQFSMNRVTPLPLDLKDSDDLGLDALESENTSRTESKSDTSKRPASLDTKRTVSSIQFDLDHFVVKADDKYVTNISQVAPVPDVTKNSTDADQTDRADSADSKEMYDQWVDEIIEGSRETSPSKSDSGSPSHKHHKSKKHKKEKKERKDREKHGSSKDGRRSRSGERKEKKTPRTKTPTSDELLLVDSDAPVDESTL
ncbi:transient receptor potential cation channel subfamily V member 5-like isoform X2 [Mercenaria mercenaria]|uniref:transient receptor potential cation channel subfamily V member 5-like isoform X2 n=1 Tax=Mercenaria mercenaria TaxID=6596 RepID=UPI00234F1CF3|nr:transient receptor potential cation channel subfamily V member 5-like isoform X2 [Mercenaria mercenaria]